MAQVLESAGFGPASGSAEKTPPASAPEGAAESFPGERRAIDGAAPSGLPTAQAAVASAMAGDAATLVELFATLAARREDPDDQRTFAALQGLAGCIGILCDALVPPGTETRWCADPVDWLVGFKADDKLTEPQRTRRPESAQCLSRPHGAVLATTLARLTSGLHEELSLERLSSDTHEDNLALAGAVSITERIGCLADDLAEALGGHRVEADPRHWTVGAGVAAALDQLQASAREGAAA